MSRFKLPLFLSILSLSLIFISCYRDDSEDETIYYGVSLPVTGAQEVPAVVTNGTGAINANYNTRSKVLSYTVSWSGLSGNVAAGHIHGLGPTGYNASVLQGFSGFPNPTLYGASGTYSGTAFMDGIILKEDDLLAGRYYVNLHTALRPGGEIRGQLILTRK